MRAVRRPSASPWTWVPTLYFAESLPYVAVMSISVIMYKNLGLSNDDIAFYTSWLYLPWVIKPLWSPFVDLLRTKRWWVVAMQICLAVALGAVAMALPLGNFFQWTLAALWIMAFCSATHDIAADGFYMLALTPHEQSFFVGIRSTFYRIGTIASQGVLVVLAGFVAARSGSYATGWGLTFLTLAALFVAFALYHRWLLPCPAADVSTLRAGAGSARILREFAQTFVSFFRKKGILPALLFMLLYRFPEAQLVKMISPFLLDSRERGGLGLSTVDVGLVYGTVGIIGLTLGGIVGGVCVARGGLRRWLWPMAWSLSLTCLAFVYLGIFQPSNLLIISAAVCVEQFGYGFGFTAYMLYLIYFSDGMHKTAHYAICTAFMALGMMLPGMFAGWLQEQLGYQGFFTWVMACCALTIAVCALIRIDPAFGRKQSPQNT